jgi:hypothetical protein
MEVKMSEQINYLELKVGEVYESKKGVIFKVIKKFSDTELWVVTKDDCTVLALPNDAVIVKKIESPGKNWFNGKPDSIIEEKIDKNRKIIEEKEEIEVSKENVEEVEVEEEKKVEEKKKVKEEKKIKEPKKVKMSDDDKAKIFNSVKETIIKTFPEKLKAKDESVIFFVKDIKCKFVKKDLMVITTAKVNGIEENKKLDNCGDFKHRYHITDLYEVIGHKA